MRLIALIILLAGNLLAAQVLAEDVVPQPLTRADCDKAGMAWNDNANVCATEAQAAEATPEAQDDQAADTAAQPLTRADCDKAGMAWNDNANVCGTEAQAAEATPEAQDDQAADTAAQPLTRADCDKAGMAWNDNANVCGSESQAAEAAAETQDATSESVLGEASTVLINIDKASQQMTVSLDGVEQYAWPVSTGLRGYSTPSGSYTARSMNKIWYSKQWDNAPMPHAVFFTKDGHAIHGTLEVKRLGKPASHGCVRLSPQNAATLYALVEESGLENTKVVLTGSTPGGEAKFPDAAGAQSSRLQDDDASRRRKRGGFLRRLFGSR
ncbi:MAG: L,D-transpeptidase [Methyloceanibacter sp.]